MSINKTRSSLNSSGRKQANGGSILPPPVHYDNRINGITKANERIWSLKGSSMTADRPGSSANREATSEPPPPRPPSNRLAKLQKHPSQASPPVLEESKDDFTIISVIDESKKQEKHFRCKMQTLLKHMKYFDSKLKATESTEDIEISVHCQVNIFEWLLNYIEHDEKSEQADDGYKFYDVVEKQGEGYKIVAAKRRKPVFEIGNAISILISSEYLKINKLVDECTRFFRDNIDEILRLPIDMSCITNQLQRKLAIEMSDEEMDAVSDKKDKLVGKLFMNKLHLLLEDESNTLFKCSYCTKLFTQEQQEKFACPSAKIFIDFHGSVIANHMLDRAFDIKKFINFLKNTLKYSWKQIYWKIYAHTVYFECKTCGYMFNGAYAKHCYYHSGKPLFSFGSNKGTYSCCKQETFRFSTSISNEGCLTRDHCPKSNSELFQKLLEGDRKYYTQEPFRPEKNASPKAKRRNK